MIKRVAVLMGGTSSERAVSLKSGKCVSSALRRAGFEVEELDVRDEFISELTADRFDVAFIALHGPFGEDGGVQALCERRGIPYTGSGVEASALAMDKALSRNALEKAGVPIPAGASLRREHKCDELNAIIDVLGYPLVVKPSREGSSIGVTMVEGPGELEAALSAVWCLDDTALIEQRISGREVTVGVLEDRALPVIEMVPGREFFDFEAKYEAEDTRYLVDPDLPESVVMELQRVALETHRTLGCEGFSRVDIMLDSELRPYVLEANTIPGFTDRSLLPMAAGAAGMSYEELCAQIVELTIRRFKTRAA
jgi:D-alanine-D-alanine ligase